MRRLYLQIYLTLIGVVLIFLMLAGVAWWIAPDRPRERHVFEEMARLAAEILPPAEAGPKALQAELERLWGVLAALAVCTPLLAFWLRSALRLAGRLASPAGLGTRLGALVTAALGIAAAAAQPHQEPASQIAFASSATCFATFFILWYGSDRRLPRNPPGRDRELPRVRVAG